MLSSARDTSATVAPCAGELRRIEQHLHFARHATDAFETLDAGHPQERLRDRIVHEPGQVPFVHARALDCIGENGFAIGPIGADGGLQEVTRKIGANPVHGFLDVDQRV